jgi:hypothetical protein
MASYHDCKHPRHYKAFWRRPNWIIQMGAIGGDSHFIKGCLDAAAQVFVMANSATGHQQCPDYYLAPETGVGRPITINQH